MKTRKIITYTACILGTLLVGTIAALASRKGFALYPYLTQPFLSPPAWLFPVVWSILYILMGISFARILTHKSDMRGDAVFSYAAQLFVNFWWPILFFAWQLRLTALFWLLLLLILILIMIDRFAKIDLAAARVNIPYVLWTLFAIYLNLSSYLLNK